MAIKPIEILINAKDNASSVFSSLQAKVATVGAAIATYFGISAFVGVVKGAADLEQGMSRVQAATGASAAEMVKLREAAEAAGANSKFSATEAAAALENLAKAGLNSTEAIAALPAVLNLAAAGDIDLATSSEFVTKAVMGMGLAFEDAGRVADVLALGANATNTSVTGLAQALSYAAPVAQSLGLSLESTVAIIGKFADAGIDASRAGTALNSILSQFSNPASKFREELAAAGITTGNFETALQQLAAAGPAGSKAIIAVGQEAGPALRALLNQGVGALADLTERLRGAEGSAAATAKVMQDNLKGAFDGLTSAWDAVKNTLGTPVLPVITQAVNELATAFRRAVADGTVGRFGESIATAFKSGLQFVREFIAGIDFAAVLARMQAFADNVNSTLAKVGEYATNAGNVFKTAWGVMTAGSNTVLLVIYKLGEAFATVAQGIMIGVAKLREGLATVTFGGLSDAFAAAAKDAEVSAGAFGAVAEAMSQKAAGALVAVGDGAQLARAGFAGLTSAASNAAAPVQATSTALGDVARQLEQVAEKNAAARKATEQKAAADQAASEAIKTLRAAYADLIARGDLQAAAEKLREINKALKETPAAAKDAGKGAEEAAKQIDAAFERLGVTSSAALTRIASGAQRDYNTIKDSGTATAEDLSRAFEVAAEKAITANRGIAPSWVQAEAAVRGFKLEAGEAGTVLVSKMTQGEEATRRVGEAARSASGGYDRLAASADKAGKSISKIQSQQYDKDGYAINSDGSRVSMAGGAGPVNNIVPGLGLTGGSIGSRQAAIDALYPDPRLAVPATSSKGDSGGGSGGGSTPGAGGAPGAQPVTVNLNFNGNYLGAVKTDRQGLATIEEFMNALEAGKGTSL